MKFTAPQSVSQNIARAKSFFRRDEALRGIDALLDALELYQPSSLIGKARFETEVMIAESVSELNRQPQVRQLIVELSKSNTASITYTPGQETTLKNLLSIVKKGLVELDAAKSNQAAETKLARRKTLEEKGLGYLKSGDLTRGKSSLRLLADEFGSEPGVLVQVALWLMDAQLYFDAVDFLELSIEKFPKNSKAYTAAITCYQALREFEQTEEIYQKAIKQFGKHTKTMTNLAKLYLEWNKKDKAFEAAASAVSLDPSNVEAKEILDSLS